MTARHDLSTHEEQESGCFSQASASARRSRLAALNSLKAQPSTRRCYQSAMSTKQRRRDRLPRDALIRGYRERHATATASANHGSAPEHVAPWEPTSPPLQREGPASHHAGMLVCTYILLSSVSASTCAVNARGTLRSLLDCCSMATASAAAAGDTYVYLRYG